MVNRRACEVLGYTHDQLLNLSVTDIEKNFSSDELSEAWKNMKPGEPATLEGVHQRKDGTRFPVEVRVGKLEYQRQEVFLALARDITSRKEVEAALRASEEKWRSLADNAPFFMINVEKDGTILYINRTLPNTSVEETTGISLYEFILPEGVDRFRRSLGMVFEGKQTPVYETEGVGFDGGSVWFEVRMGPIKHKGEIVAAAIIAMDITGRKDAEAALYESEERWRSIADNAPFFMINVERDGTIHCINRTVPPMNREEVLGKSLYDFILPEGADRLGNSLKTVFEGRVTPVYETEGVGFDGRTGWHEVRMGPIKQQGEVVAAAIIAIDITERKNAEAALYESEETWRSLAQNAPDSIINLDRDGKVLFINRTFPPLTREEVLGRSLYNLLRPEAADIVKEKVAHVFETGEVAHYEIGSDIPSGNLAWFAGRIGPVKRDDQVIAVVIIATDITERKNAEAALLESEERWRSLVQNVPDYIINLDRDGKILFINRTTSDLNPEEVLGKILYNLLPPEVSDVLKQNVENVFETGEIAYYETQRDDPTGNVEWFAGRIGPIMADDQVVAVVIIGMDITSRKLTEQLLRESEEQLREASRMASIGQLAAGVAHEINNPLTIIMGASETLMDQDLPEKTRSQIEKVHSEADRSAKIVQSLLSFARRREPEKEYLDLTGVIRKALEMKAHEFNVANIYVTNKTVSDLPRTMADSYQLMEVFLNLLNNAQQVLTEATGGGEIVIESSHSKNRIRISISDNGPGIPKENLSRIFDPFFTTKEVGKGTGLGLSICYGIVRRHDGEMWAQSVEGKGATFVTEIPVVAPVETEEAAPVDAAPGSVKRILIVDDEEGIRELFADALEPDVKWTPSSGQR